MSWELAGLLATMTRKCKYSGMDTAKRPNHIPWPPLLFGGAAVLSLALHRALPVPFPGPPVGTVLQGLGLVLVVAAIAIDLSAFITFRRHRTTILPHRGAEHLITTGIYAWSRNPIYLANLMLVAGAGLAFGIWLLVLAAPIALLATRKLAVEREERHLAHRFGAEWQDYASRTGRWFGRSR
jgi:protein-S-isoprenylcysteine O-methyltransferase Ste14